MKLAKLNPNKSIREYIQLFFFFSMILITAVFLVNIPRISLPLTISYIAYLVISPVLPKLMKFGISKTVSILVIFVGISTLSIIPIVKLVPAIGSESENFQYYITQMETYIKGNYHKVREEVQVRTGYEIGDTVIDNFFDYAKVSTTKFVLSIPKFLASILEWAFLIPLFVFFLLKDGDGFKKMVLKTTPNSIFERFYFLTHQFNKKIGDYIFAKFIEAFIIGTIITGGLLIMDIRFAAIFGIIAAVTNVIPYLGPVLGMVPGIVFCLAEYDMGTTTTGVIILFMLANAIDMGLVFPILVSKIVDIHPIVVVISVIMGSQYLGVAGMVVSIPLAVAVKLIFQEIYDELYPLVE